MLWEQQVMKKILWQTNQPLGETFTPKILPAYTTTSKN
jgi:hypothetical protein